jgi:hypothetical protein
MIKLDKNPYSILISTLNKQNIGHNLEYIRKNFHSLRKIASKNRILFPFYEALDSYKLFEKVDKKYLEEFNDQKKYYNDMVKLLKNFVETLNKNDLDYVVIQTIKPFYYINHDINILVKITDWQKTINIFKKEKNYKVKYYSTCSKKIFIKHRNFSPNIHLYSSLEWHGIEYLDSEPIFKNREKIDFNKTKIYIPSKNDELLITCAHSFFENQNLKISDLIEIYFCVKNNLNLNYILGESKKYSWHPVLIYLISITDFLYRYFFKTEKAKEFNQFNQITKLNNFIFISNNKIVFPYYYPYFPTILFRFGKSFDNVFKLGPLKSFQIFLMYLREIYARGRGYLVY